ncbi:ATP-dependent DNA helicase RecQ [Cyclobacterium lianum]|uniref:DNA helicase RecQ n=1 Tax=Cyclobacterium lianum TaxID=388280 RepID=A0A1M7KB54_9BACT|nr:DNA helicase RecQ [Cyclobacterium lianum]SHM62468.1 ATP-dependent DNA helicase RecQ [Cyclobacterium lianum]
MKPLDVLKNFYGYHSFRGHQEAIIQTVLDGKDCIALMPTGAGKSVCFQVPAMILPGLTLVLSPLIALMKDQVDAMNQLGIPAAFLNSSQDISEQRYISGQVLAGHIKILYVAPEKLYGGNYPLVDMLQKVELSLVAVDEAHCVSQWGHDFRPEYLKLGQLRKSFPSTTFLALTATADRDTRKDIADRLNLQRPQWFISSFDRPNITYRISLRSDAFAKLVDFLRIRPNDSGIIYCLSRKSVEETADRLCANGFSAVPYHAGLERDVRQANQEKFIKDEIRIIVATIAFGMGIDKSNVRFVVHTNMPQNIESYYQETGRAGRDGLPGEALLFYSFGDKITLGRMIESSDNPEYVRNMKSKLDTMVRFCQTKKCRRKFLLQYFGEDYGEECGNCDICFQKGSKTDVTIYAQMLLSAVVRLDQKFGIGHVIMVLRGSQAAKVTEQQKLLSVYGIGKDKSAEFWKLLGHQLLVEGYLLQDDPLRPVLSLTSLAWEKLKKKEKFLLSMPNDDFTSGMQQTEKDDALLGQLKVLRADLARNQNVPPYIIFSDATLEEMARYYPESDHQLLKINGVGQQKLEKYGKQFLTIIRDYLRENEINKEGKSQSKKPVKKGISISERDTLEYFKEGLSIPQIAAKRGLAQSTIEGHIVDLAMAGEIKVSALLTNAVQEEIQMVKAQLRVEKLKPLKEHFGDKYSYFQLRLATLVAETAN